MPIDGVARGELLAGALLLHDMGKFAVRRDVLRDGVPGYTFGGHEAASGEIIRSRLFDFLETGLDMSPQQRAYIAGCAARHYDLGIVRSGAKKSADGYGIAYTNSEAFHRDVDRIRVLRPDWTTEIGVLFLADNWSKVSLRLTNVETDADITEQSADLPDVLRRYGLNPGLAKAVRQHPVNVAVARRYLQLV